MIQSDKLAFGVGTKVQTETDLFDYPNPFNHF